MDDETLKALVGSIKKWTAIARGEGEDQGIRNCPLCKAFNLCNGCPVDMESRTGCCKTPYQEWCRHMMNHHGVVGLPKKIECPECRRLALKEVWFLCTLLPGDGGEDE